MSNEGRKPYTAQDRINLANFLFKVPKEDRLKPTTHKAMARFHPEHSDQSWLDHYKRAGRDKVDALLRALEKERREGKSTASASAAPVASSSKAKRPREPSTSPSGSSSSEESDRPSRAKKVAKRAKYTDEQHGVMVDVLDSAARLGLTNTQVYAALEIKFPQHSVQSWQTYYRNHRAEIENAVKAKSKALKKKDLAKQGTKAKAAENAKASGSGAKPGTSAKGKGKEKVVVLSDSEEDQEEEEQAVKDLEVFTTKDDQIMVRCVAKAELEGFTRESVWDALESQFPQHSAIGWKTHWMQDVGTFLARVPKQVDEILKSQQVKAVASKEKAVKAPTAIEKAIPEPKAVDKGIQVNGFKIEEDVDEPTTQEDDEVDQLEADSPQHIPATQSQLSTSHPRPSSSQPAPVAPRVAALAIPPPATPDVAPPTPSASPPHESQERERLAAQTPAQRIPSPAPPPSSLPSPFLRPHEERVEVEEMEEDEYMEVDEEVKEEDELEEDDRRIEASLKPREVNGASTRIAGAFELEEDDGWPRLEGAELEFVEGTYALLDGLARAEEKERLDEIERERVEREQVEMERERAEMEREERREAEEEEKRANEAKKVVKAQRDARRKADMEEAARAELEERRKAVELEARRKDEAKKLAKVEAQKKKEEEARAKIELGAKIRSDLEAKARERAAKDAADLEATRKADLEAKTKAKAAKDAADLEEKRQADLEAQATAQAHAANLEAKREADRKKASAIPPPKPSSSKAIVDHRKELKHPTPSSSATKRPLVPSAPFPIPAAVAKSGKRPRASSAAMSEAPEDHAGPSAKKARLSSTVPAPFSSTKPLVVPPPAAPVPERKLSLKEELAEYGRRFGLKTRQVMSLYFSCSAPLDMSILEDALAWYSSRRPPAGTEAHLDLELRIGRTIWTYDEDVVVLQGSDAEKKAIEKRKGKRSVAARMKFLRESEKTSVEALGARKWPFL